MAPCSALRCPPPLRAHFSSEKGFWAGVPTKPQATHKNGLKAKSCEVGNGFVVCSGHIWKLLLNFSPINIWFCKLLEKYMARNVNFLTLSNEMVCSSGSIHMIYANYACYCLGGCMSDKCVGRYTEIMQRCSDRMVEYIISHKNALQPKVYIKYINSYWINDEYLPSCKLSHLLRNMEKMQSIHTTYAWWLWYYIAPEILQKHLK